MFTNRIYRPFDVCYGCDTMPLLKTVAQNLHAARLQRKLSQAEIALAAGVSVSYVSMLERGQRSPPLETLELLAKALRVSPLDLLAENQRRRGSKR
ncbi:MAG TPA: helix-turn-helix transcriptional regulator [Anaeromyxobacteraceae bacterium]|nr:helix-turn-helix transcriptional regulator [Anaeromyxobacteraceae bacterium]